MFKVENVTRKKLKLAQKEKTMSNNQIKKFIMFYERLTNHIKNFTKESRYNRSGR